MKRSGNPKRMIVLSLDAVGSADLEFMETLPNFKRYMERASVCRHVESVYPSLTYPAHTSIVTGRYPRSHGIVNNFRFQPEREPSDWFWQRKYVKGTTLYDEAEKSGIQTAALLWPVTGKAKIHYNLPEVLPNRPWQNQILVSCLNGTPSYELALQRRFGHLREGTRQPQLDTFVQASLLYTLRTYRPGLVLAHFTDVDTNRHMYGLRSPEAMAALERHDERLGELVCELEDLGLYEDTDLVILGDHYQKDVSQMICMNAVLREHGYLTYRGGKLAGWSAIARDCDGSCYIYLKEPGLKAEVGRLLDQMKERQEHGIKRVFSTEEAAAMGADPECAFLLEAREGWYFQGGFERAHETAGPGRFMEDSRQQAATHGYLPGDASYHTFFMAAGPDFRKGGAAESMSLVDEGPTLALALGLDLGETDGRPVHEFYVNNTFQFK